MEMAAVAKVISVVGWRCGGSGGGVRDCGVRDAG